MNPYADIDEGRSEFDRERDRLHDELALLLMPEAFNYTPFQPSGLHNTPPVFTFDRALTVILLGDKDAAKRRETVPVAGWSKLHPFDYEEGRVELRDSWNPGHVLTLRWKDHGRHVEQDVPDRQPGDPAIWAIYATAKDLQQ